MTRNELNLWAANDSAFWHQVSTVDIEKLVSSFPYFAPAQMVLAKRYQLDGDYKAEQQLQRAALYSIERPKLFELIHRQAEPTLAHQIETKETVRLDWQFETIEKKSNDVEFENDKSIEHSEVLEEPDRLIDIETTELLTVDEKILEEIPIVSNQKLEEESNIELKKGEDQKKQDIHAEVNNQKRDFYAWLDALNKKQPTAQKENSSIAESIKPQKSNFDPFEIIDRFIANDPRITSAPKSKKSPTVPKSLIIQEEAPKKEFYSPENMAQKSLKDDLEIVSETLAQLYVQQGNIQKAIRAYEKLQLTKPEKSTYFTALIEKLNQQA